MKKELENYPNAKFFNSLDALFESGLEVDAVAIATPNGFHQEQGLQVLENNCHVVIEKPIHGQQKL